MRNFLITKKTYKCGKLVGFEIPENATSKYYKEV